MSPRRHQTETASPGRPEKRRSPELEERDESEEESERGKKEQRTHQEERPADEMNSVSNPGEQLVWYNNGLLRDREMA